MANWEYGKAYEQHPIKRGIAVFPDGSRLKVHDIFNPLPNFMMEADLVFVDPPWSKGNLNTFYTKADMSPKQQPFSDFYERLFACIKQINPKICYVEIGKEYLVDFMIEMKKTYKYVTLYNSSYYHRKENICYVVRGANKAKKPKLDGMDEEDIIEWIMANEDCSCVADLCMGQGLVAINAYKNGKKFVGTELNHKRLSVTLKRLFDSGTSYEIEEVTETLGEILMAERTKRNLSRAEVAAACNITVQSYFRYETEEKAGGKMAFSTAYNLSKMLGLKLDDMARLL